MEKTNKRTMERRVLNVEELRVKRSDDAAPRIEGYAAVFNKLSEDLGGFREKIEPGAFKKALKKSDARALFNHRSDYVLGRQTAKTLTLKEDDKGLFMSVLPPDTQFARDLLVSIDRGDITQQSFGFYLSSDKWENIDNKKETIRTLLLIDEIIDVSPVTFPAYPDTDVAVRSLAAATAEFRALKPTQTPTGPGSARNRERSTRRERFLKLKQRS